MEGRKERKKKESWASCGFAFASAPQVDGRGRANRTEQADMHRLIPGISSSRGRGKKERGCFTYYRRHDAASLSLSLSYRRGECRYVYVCMYVCTVCVRGMCVGYVDRQPRYVPYRAVPCGAALGRAVPYCMYRRIQALCVPPKLGSLRCLPAQRVGMQLRLGPGWGWLGLGWSVLLCSRAGTSGQGIICTRAHTPSPPYAPWDLCCRRPEIDPTAGDR